jgi:AcrR family transcriptional regulator
VTATLSFQRARKPEERAQRQKEILEAAAILFEEKGLAGVSLNAVARRAGITKSNLYRYYESREAMFLALLGEDLAEYAAIVEERLAHVTPGDVRAVARVMAEALVERPRFCALTAAVSAVLEQNISEEGAMAYKRDVLRVGIRFGNALRAALPSLPPQAIGPLLRYTHALVGGLHPLAHPAPSVERAIQRAPELGVFRADFGADFETLFAATLAFLCAGR